MHLALGSEFDLDAALIRLGYPSFRPGQREAVETLLTRRRLLLVAPTGGGKSLIYQLPATVLGGTTLVVSPLVSLMHDQVSALEARGVPATFLAATLDADEVKRRMSRLARGEFSIAYVAPERLAFPGFRGLARDLDCPLIAVDEAHCISEWGHDFRPEYLQIGDLVTDLPDARVLACTATATPVVRDEILERLGLPADTPQLVRGFARPNLALRVRETRTARDVARIVDAALDESLGRPAGGRGTAIIYAPTRAATEEECERLSIRGWSCAPYHAGLNGVSRSRAQQRFSDGKLDLIVATNAFGMGIDRADVRAVIHLAPPGSIEAYYQEVGRAGRDGEPAVGVLCTSPGDLPRRRRLLEMPTEGVPLDAARMQHKWSMFLELMRWTEGGSCRHDAILRYFGDEAETLSGCGNCDNCTALGEPEERIRAKRRRSCERRSAPSPARTPALDSRPPSNCSPAWPIRDWSVPACTRRGRLVRSRTEARNGSWPSCAGASRRGGSTSHQVSGPWCSSPRLERRCSSLRARSGFSSLRSRARHGARARGETPADAAAAPCRRPWIPRRPRCSMRCEPAASSWPARNTSRRT
jgi:ATP-dependent DNA helicase RecQ